MNLRGVIFDLDATLVDSKLDFDLMRREMGLVGSRPILETLNSLATEEAKRLWAIVGEHELRGVARATLFPGAGEFLDELASRGIKRGVLTRNSRASTLATLARFDLEMDYVLTREDGPVKPDPAGIQRMCAAWGVSPRECVMIGDYRFDIEAGQRAGTRTVLFTGAGHPHGMDDGQSADLTLPCFTQRAEFWDWTEQFEEGKST
jgi:HAD superfamily hydrolase (TIGR01509 family)